MKQQEIYELISVFETSSLTGLVIEQDSFHIELKREPAPVQPVYAGMPAASVANDAGVLCTGGAKDAAAAMGAAQTGARQTGGKATDLQSGAMEADPLQAETAQAENLQEVRSPIVGVYYAAPAPGEPPYVTAGQKVEQGQVLCLIEAMKMMNELKSPVSGIVRAIRGVDGELAEYDQVLFEVEPC